MTISLMHTCIERPEQPCDACNPPGPHVLQVREDEDLYLILKNRFNEEYIAVRYKITRSGTLQYLAQEKLSEQDIDDLTNSGQHTIAESYKKSKQTS